MTVPALRFHRLEREISQHYTEHIWEVQVVIGVTLEGQQIFKEQFHNVLLVVCLLILFPFNFSFSGINGILVEVKPTGRRKKNQLLFSRYFEFCAPETSNVLGGPHGKKHNAASGCGEAGLQVSEKVHNSVRSILQLWNSLNGGRRVASCGSSPGPGLPPSEQGSTDYVVLNLSSW